MPVGVVVERRRIENPWQPWRWRPVAVLPGAGEAMVGTELERGDDFTRSIAARLTLTLHRKETEGYRVGLSAPVPLVFVVLRPDGDGWQPFLATVSPYEAQQYTVGGDEVVETVPMPDAVIAWVRDFVEHHHVDEPFVKRKRKGGGATGDDSRPESFARRPRVPPSHG
ncbi:MAG: DUF3305 domain-containing protein [Inquilinus sp.]|nr:DUF3305 domain-containing protein [Inquilinus sp.]